MTWDQPTFTEIKMDAEFTAYCEDWEPEPEPIDAWTGEAPCGSGS